MDEPADAAPVELVAPLVNRAAKRQLLSSQSVRKSRWLRAAMMLTPAGWCPEPVFTNTDEWMNIYRSTSILRGAPCSEYSLFFCSQMFSYVREGVQVFPRRVHHRRLSVPPPPPPTLLEDLLRAGGGDVQQPPGGAGVELLLVPAQRPHVHHPHHLPLDRRGQKLRQKPPSRCMKNTRLVDRTRPISR